MTTFDLKKALTEIIEGIHRTIRSMDSLINEAQENLSKYEKLLNDASIVKGWLNADLLEKQAMLRALIQKEKEDINNSTQ